VHHLGALGLANAHFTVVVRQLHVQHPLVVAQVLTKSTVLLLTLPTLELQLLISRVHALSLHPQFPAEILNPRVKMADPPVVALEPHRSTVLSLVLME
jgi:hypothetical protein